MKKSELRQMIKEEILKELSNKISNSLYNDIFRNHYKTVEVGLRYARNAGDMFQDSFRKYGKMTSTNVFRFNSAEYTADFVDNLIRSLHMPEDELEVSK